MIQIGGVYIAFCQEKGILVQKYRDRNGRYIAMLFRSIGIRGRFDSPEIKSVISWTCSSRGLQGQAERERERDRKEETERNKKKENEGWEGPQRGRERGERKQRK